MIKRSREPTKATVSKLYGIPEEYISDFTEERCPVAGNIRAER